MSKTLQGHVRTN